MTDNELQAIVDRTLSSHADHAREQAGLHAASAFQWPWDIAKAGATHLGDHGGAVGGLVTGGSAVESSPQGAAMVSAVKSGPTDPSATSQVLNDSLFGPAISSVKADQLLRTVLIGSAGGAQVGPVGGSGGSGVAYDIIDQADRHGITYSEFDLGIGAKAGGGLVVGAFTDPPSALNHSTNVWAFGASMAVSVFVQVIMRSSDLGLVGFALTLGVGVGISSSTGYGSISTT